MLGLLIALVPTVMWGFVPVAATKLGGGPKNQVIGTTLGALVFSFGASFFVRGETTSFTIWISLISGIFWAVGQMNQFIAIKAIGVSKTMPISTGMQLVGVTLCGVVLFHEWSTPLKMILGITAIVLIIVGVAFTAYRGEKETEGGGRLVKGLATLVVSSIGYICYIVILRYFDIDGWVAILPQSIGMVIGSVILSDRGQKFNRYTMKNIITGLMWATGNLGLLIAAPLVGVATSFSLAQMGIVLSTLSGIFILGEKKSAKQMIFVIIGCLLVVGGGVCIGLARAE
ncbi:glucose transporter GlcU [Sporolactobacillus sp. THM7-7]|nr:glucose transporter GlcU [Sporolactobacillus sp. THM7-7]